MQKQLEFRKVMETKGAVRYAEKLGPDRYANAPNDPGAKIGTLYIRKEAFNGSGIPEVVHVTFGDQPQKLA